MRKYTFKPYSDIFPELFKREKERLSSLNALAIEHVGSTAVPGLGGKGIIDIAILVEQSEMQAVKEEIQKLGYEFRESWSTPQRLFFRIDLPDSAEGKRRYHIHLMCRGSQEWEDFLTFRDYLIGHPEEAKKYGELKKKAAEEVDEDGEKYRALKAPFFKQILKDR